MALGLFADFPRLDLPSLFKNAKVPILCINASTDLPLAVPTEREFNEKLREMVKSLDRRNEFSSQGASHSEHAAGLCSSFSVRR